MSNELLEAYQNANTYLDGFEFLFRNQIPFEEWPPEYQAIAGINEELLGPATKENNEQ